MDSRRATFRAVLLCYLVSQGAAKSFDVVWLSPAEGKTYNHGDTIVGKWTSTSAVVSPSFKLCEVLNAAGGVSKGLDGRGGGGGEDEKCGTAIWPQVQEAEDGYMITITAPEASEKSEYCLEMQDNFGNVFTSPVFELGVTSRDRAPSSGPAEVSATSTKASDSPTSSVGAAKHLSASPSVSSGFMTPNITAISPPRIGVPSSSTQPDILLSRRPVPTAAFAVPLSVVSGIILVAGLLCLSTRRKMAKERRQEFKTLILSKREADGEGSGSAGEVQRAISILSRKDLSGYSNSLEPVPLFLPRPEPRVATRNAYAPMANSVSSSTIFDDGSLYLYEEPIVTRAKSLTDQYTAAGTKPRPGEDFHHVLSPTLPTLAIPTTLLPARLPPLHVRSESPGTIHPLPVPPSQSSSSSLSGAGDVYDAIAAKLKRS